MQSKSQAFPMKRAFVLFTLLSLAAAPWSVSQVVRAQTVAGYSSSNPVITGIMSKGAGQAEVTITGVVLQSSLFYCLIGVGHGNWYGSTTNVQIDKIGCAKPEGGKVVIPIRLDPKRYETKGAVIGYIPIGVESDGKIATWLPKPSGSLPFERSNGQTDQAVAITWSTAGIAVLATAEQAKAIND